MNLFIRNINISLPFYVFLLILSIVLVFLLQRAMIRRKFSKLLPSRCQYFIDVLGDLRNFSKKEYLRTGYPLNSYILKYISAFCVLFKKEDLFCFWFSYSPAIVFNKPDAIMEVLSKTKFHEKAWMYEMGHFWLGNGLFLSKGEKWKSRRKLLTPAFHFGILKDFQVIFNEKSQALVENLKKEIDKDYTDILPHFTLCSLDVVYDTILGTNVELQKNGESEYLKTIHNFTRNIVKRALNPLFWFDIIYFLTSSGRKTMKDVESLKSFSLSIIQEKKKVMLKKTANAKMINKRKSLVDMLLEHHLKTKDLTDEDVRVEVDTFTYAAHDTTALCLTWTLYHLGLNKHVLNKLYEELDAIFGTNTSRNITTEDLKNLKYLECVIKESLRLCPPVPIFARKVPKQVNIRGYPIPEGASLAVCPYMLHRNEEVYPEPEVFDPSRFTPENESKRHPYAFIPFSAGPRNCIGQKYAMVEVKTILAYVLRNFTVESLDPPDKMVPSMDVVMRPSGLVRIKIRPRLE